jgi:hypothetical protein
MCKARIYKNLSEINLLIYPTAVVLEFVLPLATPVQHHSLQQVSLYHRSHKDIYKDY